MGSRRGWIPAFLLATSWVLGGGVETCAGGVQGSEPAIRVEVGTFENLTGDPEKGWLADAFREAAALGLVHVRGMQVLPVEGDSARAEMVLSGDFGRGGAGLRVRLFVRGRAEARALRDTLIVGDAGRLLGVLPGAAVACAARPWVELSPDEQGRIDALGFTLEAEEDTAAAFFRAAAGAYERLGMHRQAGDLLLRAASRLRDPESAEGAAFRVRAGMAFQNAEDLPQALELIQLGMKVHRQRRMALEEAEDEDHLGRVYASMGRVKEARRSFAQAQKRLEGLPGRGETPVAEVVLSGVLHHTGDLLAESGEAEEALKVYRKAVEIQERLGLGPRLAETLRDMGTVRANRGEIAEAFALYDRAVALQTGFNADRELGKTLTAVADVHLVRGAYDSAMTALGRARDLYDRAGPDGGLAENLVRMGEVCAQQERPAQALQFYGEARSIQERLGLSRAGARTDVWAGRAHLLRGERGRALELYRRAEAVQARLGLKGDLAQTCEAIAQVYRLQKMFKEAEAFYRRAEEIAQKLNLKAELAGIYNGLGGSCVDAGDPSRALGYYNRARKAWKALGRGMELALVLKNMGVAYESLGETDRAAAHYEQALRLAREIDFRLGIAVSAEHLGMLRAQTEGPEAGLALMQEACDIRQAVDARLALARSTYPGLAHLFEKMGRADGAAEYYEKAVGIFDEFSLVDEGVAARYRLGQLYRLTGRYDGSLKALQQASSLVNASVEPVKMGNILEEIGITQMHRGAWAEGVAALDSARVLCERLTAEAEIYLNATLMPGGQNLVPLEVYQERIAQLWEQRGVALGMSGRWKEAVVSYQQGRAVLENALKGVRSALSGMRGRGAVAGRRLNRLGDAADRIAYRIAVIDNRLGVAHYHTRGQADAGDMKRLKALFTEVLKKWRSVGHRERIAVALNNIGVIAWALGDEAEAFKTLNMGVQATLSGPSGRASQSGVAQVPEAKAVESPRVAVPLLLNLGALLEHRVEQIEASGGGTVGKARTDSAGDPTVQAIYSTVKALMEGMPAYPSDWQSEVLLIGEKSPDARLKEIKQ